MIQCQQFKGAIHFSLMLLLAFSVPVVTAAQNTPRLPEKFYKLKTNGEKALYLKRMIKDSISAQAFTDVPLLCHMALAFSAKSGSDSLNPMLYQYLGDAYDNTDSDSAALYFRKSLSAYRKVPLTKKLYLIQSLVYSYVILNKRDSILFYIHELEKAIKTLPDTSKNKIKVVNTIASSYSEISQYENAIKNYRFAIKQGLQIKDSSGTLVAMINAGLTYNLMDNNQMAIYYSRQALPYLGKNNHDRMITYSNLADYYIGLDRKDSANYFLSKAEILAKQMKDGKATNALAIKRAGVMILEKKYVPARPLLQQSLEYFLKREPAIDIVNCLLLFGSLDTAQNNYKLAEKHLSLLYGITEKMETKAYTLETLKLFIPVKEHLQKYKEAFLLQKIFIAVDDSTKTKEASEGLALLQTEYQTSRKEEQIRLLQKESLIKDLKIEAGIRNKTLFIFLILTLIFVFSVIYYIRQLRSKTTLQNLKATLEMKALRSQMNPHFIFNSLNSIQKYIWENRQEDASEYLTKFARLIRLVLENSLHSSVKLTEELTSLRLYVEMEHRRNNQKFDYSITVADNIDTENVFIPPLLLQPYVENAIWHGLSQKDGHGRLDIVIEKTDKNLTCRIEDDGIGRTRSAEIKVNAIRKKSLAMNISSQRIVWLQKDSGVKSSVEITDKYNGDFAAGTIVILTLPLLKNDD